AVEVLGHANERHLVLFKQLHQLRKVKQRPAEPIDAMSQDAVDLRARSDRPPSARACKRQAMRLTSQTLLCDGVGSPKTSANLMRSSETRSRGNAAISTARFGSIGNSPKVERARCPPPPSPLSLGSLRIARQSPRDFHGSFPLQKASKTWIF